MGPTELPSVGEQRAKRFLNDIVEMPFVAIVFDDEHTQVYTKGLSEESLRKIQAAVELITSEEQHG